LRRLKKRRVTRLKPVPDSGMPNIAAYDSLSEGVLSTLSTALHPTNFRSRDPESTEGATPIAAEDVAEDMEGADDAAMATEEADRSDDRTSRRSAKKSGHKRTLMDRVDAFASRLAARNNFWQRLASLFWLPYAFKSGIRMKRIDAQTFSAVLPFRRFNRNWYNAMAGAALLANSEVAGGMYVFGICGGDYEVVCKNLEYRFLRPCLGPAVYKISPREDVAALAAAGHEFNVTLDLDIVQQLKKPRSKDRRVGRCVVTFHVTPKMHQKIKGRKD
jgi:hypothetical protein